MLEIIKFMGGDCGGGSCGCGDGDDE